MKSRINTIYFDVALADLKDIAKDFPNIIDKIDELVRIHNDLVEQARGFEAEIEDMTSALDEANGKIEYLEEELEYATQE